MIHFKHEAQILPRASKHVLVPPGCVVYLQCIIHGTYHNYALILILHQKEERRAIHAQKETEFLRLKRSRLGIDDFDSLKVIGRGAFGEVSH